MEGSALRSSRKDWQEEETLAGMRGLLPVLGTLDAVVLVSQSLFLSPPLCLLMAPEFRSPCTPSFRP